MSKVRCFQVGYYFAPQDRRKIGEEEMSAYVLSHYRRIFRQFLFDEKDVSGRELRFKVLNATRKQVEKAAAKICPVIDLSDESFYTITEVLDE